MAYTYRLKGEWEYMKKKTLENRANNYICILFSNCLQHFLKLLTVLENCAGNEK